MQQYNDRASEVVLSVDSSHAPSIGRARPGAFALSLLAAACTHAAIALALMTAPPSNLGAGGEDLEAIGVDVVSAAALESQRPVASIATGTIAPIAPPGSANVPDQPTVDAAPRERAPDAPPLWVQQPDTFPLSEIVLPTEPPKIEPTQKPTPPQPVAEDKPSLVPAAVGSDASARIVEPSISNQSATRAAPGVIKAYGRAVGEALKASRPQSSGGVRATGRVLVEFTIGDDGRLAALAIKSSSGSQHLDQMAMNAVRSAKLPIPDAALSARERTFSIPYTFR